MAVADQAEFEAALRRDGFDEIGVKEVSERPINEPHSHTFDARVLILEGAFTLTIDGESTTYRPGETYYVPAGCTHQETIPPGGARYVFGQRFNSAAS